jgi:hypothetical protein
MLHYKAVTMGFSVAAGQAVVQQILDRIDDSAAVEAQGFSVRHGKLQHVGPPNM